MRMGAGYGAGAVAACAAAEWADRGSTPGGCWHPSLTLGASLSPKQSSLPASLRKAPCQSLGIL